MFNEEKRRFLLLSAILVVISMIATCSTVFLLYREAVAERRADLVATAQSQARLIEAVARFDRKYAPYINDDLPDYDPTQGTLEQLFAAHQAYPGFGTTGEFVLARRQGTQIRFLFRHHHNRLEIPDPIAFEAELAEPMRRALSGESGTLIGLDYHGELVLAAYEPVAVLDLGIVAKVDLSEVRAPFVRATAAALLVTLLLVGIGVLLLKKTIAPLFFSLRATSDELISEMTQHHQALSALQESEERFRQIAAVAPDVFWLVDCHIPDAPQTLYLNQAFELLWQSPIAAALQDHFSWAEKIHPEDKQPVLTAYRDFLRGAGPFDLEFRLLPETGELRHLWMKGELLRDERGQPARAAGIVHDLTSIKAAEQLVQQTNRDLERKVAERTAELSRTIRLMSGREVRMAELKKENRQLRERFMPQEDSA